MNYQNLSEAEAEIMSKIWELDVPVSSARLTAEFSETRGWKAQTVCTFLSRLVSKNYLSVEKRGAANLYTAVVSKKDFERSAAMELISKSYNGSVKNMIASLVDGGAISREEMEELKDWFKGV